MIALYAKGKQASVMVWAGFSGLMGTTDLVIMERDKESPKGGYSAASYIKTLTAGLLSYFDSGLEFMHDNAPIHTARLTTAWLLKHKIEAMDWPPYSPDLNPIEHIWVHLKNKLITNHPELLNEHGSHDRLRTLMAPLLIEAWGQIEDRIFEKCWKSMPKRCAAIIKAKGWYTKY